MHYPPAHSLVREIKPAESLTTRGGHKSSHARKGGATAPRRCRRPMAEFAGYHPNSCRIPKTDPLQ